MPTPRRGLLGYNQRWIRNLQSRGTLHYCNLRCGIQFRVLSLSGFPSSSARAHLPNVVGSI